MRTLLVAALLLLLTACGDEPDAGSDQDAAGFTVVRNAVEFPSVSDWVTPGQGLRQLVPLGDCVLGVGTYANGQRHVGANWAGNDDCTKLTLDPPPRDDQPVDGPPDRGGWSGGGGSGIVLPWDDGALIGASEALLRSAPDGTVTPLATIPFDTANRSPEATRDPAATAITRSGNRILVVGQRIRARDRVRLGRRGRDRTRDRAAAGCDVRRPAVPRRRVGTGRGRDRPRRRLAHHVALHPRRHDVDGRAAADRPGPVAGQGAAEGGHDLARRRHRRQPEGPRNRDLWVRN